MTVAGLSTLCSGGQGDLKGVNNLGSTWFSLFRTLNNLKPSANDIVPYNSKIKRHVGPFAKAL